MFAMTNLILEELDFEGDPDKLSALLRREANMLSESFAEGIRKGEGERIVKEPSRTGVLDRGIRRFIWWCLGSPIRGNA